MLPPHWFLWYTIQVTTGKKQVRDRMVLYQIAVDSPNKRLRNTTKRFFHVNTTQLIIGCYFFLLFFLLSRKNVLEHFLKHQQPPTITYTGKLRNSLSFVFLCLIFVEGKCDLIFACVECCWFRKGRRGGFLLHYLIKKNAIVKQFVVTDTSFSLYLLAQL